MKRYIQFTMFMILAALAGCQYHYIPPAIQTGAHYLVVDGIINNNDTTVIKLSRTVNLYNAATTQPETGAQVSVESDANATFALKELKTKGSYASSAPLILNKAAKYRLRIVSGSNTYLSDFVPVKDAPPIDSVNYTFQPGGVQVYLNTHDATNNTRYYRYEYADTWIFRSAFYSSYVYLNNQVVTRDLVNNNISTCWSNGYSTDITLASSAKLTQDVIYQQPVTLIPALSSKLRIRYSINIKQYALTEDAFNFWQILKTNTEQLGSIFDAQPSQIKGNIHNVNNSAEPVFGYISAGAVQQKRIFIDRTIIPNSYQPLDPYAACDPNTAEIVISINGLGQIIAGSFVPLSEVYSPITGQLSGYLSGTRECTDCTLRGYNKKPSFWQ